MSQKITNNGKIRIHIDPSRITIDDLILFRELSINMRGAINLADFPAKELKEFIAKFMVDQDRRPMEFEQAYPLAGKLTLPELKETFQGISATIQELQAAAVPPEPGSA